MSEHPKKNIDETILPEPPGWFAKHFQFQSELDAETFVQTLRKLEPIEGTYIRSINPDPPYHFVLKCSYYLGDEPYRYAFDIVAAGEIHAIPNMNMCRISGYIKGDDPVAVSCFMFILLIGIVITGLLLLLFSRSYLMFSCVGLVVVAYVFLGIFVTVGMTQHNETIRLLIHNFQQLIKQVEANAAITKFEIKTQ